MKMDLFCGWLLYLINSEWSTGIVSYHLLVKLWHAPLEVEVEVDGGHMMVVSQGHGSCKNNNYEILCLALNKLTVYKIIF